MNTTYTVDLEPCLVVEETTDEAFESLAGIHEVLNTLSLISKLIDNQVKEMIKIIARMIREFIEAINRSIHQMYTIALEVELSTQYIAQDFSPRSPPRVESFKDKIETYYIWFCMFVFNPFLNYLFKMGFDNLVWKIISYLFKLIFGMH